VESILLAQLVVLGIVLTFAALYRIQSNDSVARKLAKIRVRVDDTRQRGIPPPQEEEDFEPWPFLGWLILGLGLLFFLILAANL
jgi:hypothetical protein